MFLGLLMAWQFLLEESDRWQVDWQREKLEKQCMIVLASLENLDLARIFLTQNHEDALDTNAYDKNHNHFITFLESNCEIPNRYETYEQENSRLPRGWPNIAVRRKLSKNQSVYEDQAP
jgi:hypothetical protein